MIALSIGLWLTVPYQMYLGIIIEWPSMNRLQVSRKNESSAEKLAESYLAGLAGDCYLQIVREGNKERESRTTRSTLKIKLNHRFRVVFM